MSETEIHFREGEECDCPKFERLAASLKRKHERLEMVGWFVALHSLGKIDAESAMNRIFAVTCEVPPGQHDINYIEVKKIAEELEKS